jgi:hypothetical protein
MDEDGAGVPPRRDGGSLGLEQLVPVRLPDIDELLSLPRRQLGHHPVHLFAVDLCIKRASTHHGKD